MCVLGLLLIVECRVTCLQLLCVVLSPALAFGRPLSCSIYPILRPCPFSPMGPLSHARLLALWEGGPSCRPAPACRSG